MKTLGWKKRASGALYVLVLTLGLGSLGRAATNVWTPKADMPTARYLPAACAVDGKIYVVGGALSHHVVIAAAEVYDPATHAWTRKADMPVASAGMGAAVVDGKIYVMGGLLSLRSTYEYDPAANAWTRKADMPTGRALLCASAVKGKIYAIGGAVDTPGPAFTTVEGYDPATDTWTRKADAPTARAWLSASALNGRIYVIGGVFGVNGTMYLAGGDSGPRRASVEEYDPATDIWTTRSDLPTPRGGLSTVSLNGRVYAVGGMKTFWDSFVTVEEYDPYPLIVDFNGDGIVDTSDLLPLIESWGRNDPAVDIGPRPCGDGIIDATDLEILMGYWGQEVQDSTLRAHWKLDEAEGSLASGSAGNGAGTVVGVPAWQPAGGVRGGALEFDGTAFIQTDAAFDPSVGPLSVFAWVKGGAPGQAILSQQGGVNWLSLDPVTGALMTELAKSTPGNSLFCAVVISDGAWHRIGFTWDGLNRSLYADDVLAAADAPAGLAGCLGNLMIGVGKSMNPGAFWSGLIDEVRIYSRAVNVIAR